MKTTDRIKAHPKVQEYWHETENGHWASLKPGWRCIYADAHSCREDTLTDLLRAVRDSEPCDCNECKPTP